MKHLKLSQTFTPIILLCAINSSINSAWAQLAPRNMAQTETAIRGHLDSRIVVFPYNKDGVFDVRTRVERFTRLSLPEGETVRGFYLSDTIQWEYHVSADKRNVLIKPIQPGIATTATLLTSNREFDIDLRESGSNWHQRVTWAQEPQQRGRFFEEVSSVPSPVSGAAMRSQQAAANPGASQNGASPTSPTRAASNDALSLPCNPAATEIRSGYRVEGKTAFNPTHVWDDGRKYSCIKLPDDVQELPALFALNAEGKPEIADYRIRDGVMYSPRLFVHGALLKLGKEEVRILAGAK